MFFSGNVTNFPAVLQPPSTSQWFRLLTVCCQRLTNQPIVFCVVRPTLNSLALAKRAVSRFSSRAAALVSRVSRLRRSRARALLPLNLKKKRDCSQSRERVTWLGNFSTPGKVLPLRYLVTWFSALVDRYKWQISDTSVDFYTLCHKYHLCWWHGICIKQSDFRQIQQNRKGISTAKSKMKTVDNVFEGAIYRAWNIQ